MAEQLLVGLLERPRCAPHDGIDRAGADAGAKQFAKELRGVAAGDAVTYRESGNRRLETWAEGPGWHPDRKLGARFRAAVGTAQAMQPVLGEEDRDRGQLRDLMASRLANGATLRLTEVVAAAAALGSVVDELIERLDRYQPATVA